MIDRAAMAEHFRAEQCAPRWAARLWSLPAALAHLSSFTADRAGQIGKSASLTVKCQPILVRQAIIDAVIPTLVQFLRNAIEHGIETPTERLVAGKALTGALSIAVAANNGVLLISVSDDGRGIEDEQIVQTTGAIAVSSDALHAANSDAWRSLLLRHGIAVEGNRRHVFGLKRAAARLSGVRGRIGFRSEAGQGTTFQMTIPMHGDDVVVMSGSAEQRPARDLTAAASAPGGR